MQLVSATIAIVGASKPAEARVFSGVQATPQAAPPADASELAPTPLEADLLSFAMQVPTGTSVRIERGPSPSYLLAEASDNPRWRMRAASLRASKLATTAQSQCQDFLDELKAIVPETTLNKPISSLELSVRARKALQLLNIASIGELASRTEAELMGVKNFGATSLHEIRERLAQHGLTLRQLS